MLAAADGVGDADGTAVDGLVGRRAAGRAIGAAIFGVNLDGVALVRQINLERLFPVEQRAVLDHWNAVDENRNPIAVLALGVPDTKARIERAPFRRAVRFPKGAGKNPMVTRTVRVFHPDNEAMKPGDREKFHPTEMRLEEMGFTRA